MKPKRKVCFFSKQRLSCHSTAQYTSEANGPIQPAVCKSIFILHYYIFAYITNVLLYKLLYKYIINVICDICYYFLAFAWIRIPCK